MPTSLCCQAGAVLRQGALVSGFPDVMTEFVRLWDTFVDKLTDKRGRYAAERRAGQKFGS